MKDVTINPDEESEYECFSCGTIVVAKTPTKCPDCETDMRNRAIPLE